MGNPGTVACICALIAASGVSAGAGGGATGLGGGGCVPLTVAVVAASDVPTTGLEAAQALTADLYRAAGVTLRWITKYDEQRPAITVVLTRRAGESGRLPDALGVAPSPGDGTRGTIAFVFVDRVTAFADRHNLLPWTVLGGAIAHEIGHLLLPPNAHVRDGIMRASWRPSHFPPRAAGVAGFPPEQARLLRRRVASRRSATTPTNVGPACTRSTAVPASLSERSVPGGAWTAAVDWWREARMTIRQKVAAGCAIVACAITGSAFSGLLAGTREGDNRAAGSQAAQGGLIREVREGTALYRDPNVAMGAGYGSTGSCVSGPQAGAMGVHFANPALIGDPALDPRNPELLIYEQRGGRMRFVGVEFLVIAEAWHAANPAPPVLMGQHFHYVGAPNRYGLPPFYELHVWAWRDNPNGAFVDWNTAVTCEDYAGDEPLTASLFHDQH